MDAQHLLTIYPQATIQAIPATGADTFCIPMAGGKYLCIDASTISSRELALLELLTQAKAEQVDSDEWTDFLKGKSPAPHVNAQELQLLHFHVRFMDNTQDHASWLNALANLFGNVVHKAFTSGSAGYLLLQEDVDSISDSNMVGMLSLLDNDFYTNTRIFIGTSHKLIAALPATYALERQLFAHNNKARVVTISNSILPYLVADRRSELALLGKELLRDEENIQLITALYHTQGNVRQAAEHLFVHRNTLLYRIDKFEKATGFNLKTMDDLVCCYLLTLG